MSYPYLISVRLMVYNHEPFIREAMESILNQKTNFLFEVVIGDDFSTDKSLEIIREYQNTSNIHIKILERKIGDEYWQNRQKLGRLYNFFNTLENCTGKYIALIDGDDYWTDPYKLQKQVDFLEANPEYSFSMGKVKLLKQQSGKIVDRKERVDPGKKETYILKDYLKGLFSQTSTFVFRNNLESFPSWFFNVHAGDQSIVVIMTGTEGKIKYHNDFFSIYRGHEKSISNTVNYNVYEKFLETLEVWNLHLNKKYNFLFKISKVKYRVEIKLEKSKSRYQLRCYKFIRNITQQLIECF